MTDAARPTAVRAVRFGDFVHEATVRQRRVSYNDLVPPPARDASGAELPYRPPKVELLPRDVYRLLRPYVSVRFIEQVKAVAPLGLYLALFQVAVLRQRVADSWVITGGLLAVVLGLMLFMEGLRLGLMPFAERIGATLPTKSTLPVVLIVAFLLGVGVTFAEPAIGALQAAGAIVQVERAPYLYSLLNQRAGALVLVVGAGVGAAAVLGTLRFIYGWSLKPLIYASLVPTVALTVYAMLDRDMAPIIGLAWDCGGVTTGPVTVPLVLSLGIGVATAVGKGDSSLSGFGIVTLASIFPVLGVLLLGAYVVQTVPVDAIVAAATATAGTSVAPAWHERTPGIEIVLGVRAVVPLIVFLLFVLRFMLSERLREAGVVAYGLLLTIVGMVVFNLGLTYGLARLGGQSGGLVPAAFASIEAVTASPLYSFVVGVLVAVGFAWVLGFGATLAEPALNALGITVENLTNGAFKRSALLYAVSVGVGCGIATGVAKIIFDIPLGWLLLPTYALAVALTALSTEEYVNIAWDSAGVTTGPVTVPLVLAAGLGFGDAVGAADGFGILAMASIGPILSVLATGLWVRWQTRRATEAEAASGPPGPLEVSEA